MPEKSQTTSGGFQVLPLLIFAGLALVPLCDFLLPLVGFEPVGRRYVKAPLELGWRDVVNGSLGEKIEEFFLSRSFVRHGSGARYNEAVYVATNRVPGIRVGSDHWLFIKDDTLELENALVASRLKDNLEFISTAKQRFEKLGIPLFVSLIPDRTRLYAQRVYQDGRLPPNRLRLLSEHEAGLKARGIPVLNLMNVLAAEIAQGRDTHFAEDHHWNFHGGKIAAKECAKWIQSSLPALETLPIRPNKVTQLIDSDSPYHSLVSLMKFQKNSEVESRFLNDQAVTHYDLDWSRMAPTGENASGLLLETSFGMFGFPQEFESSLNTRVDAKVTPGNGSAYPVAAFLADDPSSMPHYRFALWEIPEYHLVEGLANQGLGEPILLPKPMLSNTDFRSVRPAEVKIDGMRKGEKQFDVENREIKIRFRFDSPVDAVRLSFQCTGGAKRGQILCAKSGPGGYLVLPSTKHTLSYDFPFETRLYQVEVKLRFRDLDYHLRHWKVEGLRRSSPESPATPKE